MNVKAVVHLGFLPGSQGTYLQKVATVYIDGTEYSVYAPADAVGDALEWIDHFRVRHQVDLSSEADAPDSLRILVVKMVEKELKGTTANRNAVAKTTTPAAASDDNRFARLAIDEARKSVAENDGRPHPMVGAVVVKNGQLLATAHRGEVEGNHAEYMALEKRLADSAVAGATVYTTLEPCTTRNHPKIPCADRLIERKVGRVVIGMLDPDPRITGRGLRRLRDANIITDLFSHDLMAEVEELNREFMRYFNFADKAAESNARRAPQVSNIATALGFMPVTEEALSVRLDGGQDGGFLIFVQNRSDQEFEVQGVTVQWNGSDLGNMNRPAAGEKWAVSPDRGCVIRWSNDIRPVQVLLDLTKVYRGHTDEFIEFVFQCSVAGKHETLRKKIKVTVDALNRRMTQWS
jgi:pyrimidine deaminase RibD-like protein